LVRRHFFLIAAMTALALMVLVGAWRLLAPSEAEAQGGPGGGGGRAPVVRVVSPQTQTFADQLEALGEAKARQSVDITSDSTELITRVRFSSGQTVQRGQVLVELKADEQAAEVARARAAVNQAEREYERFRELGERGFAPRARIEELQAALQDTQATLRAVQARAQDRVIRAPFSGVIGLSDAAPGQLVNPGAVIATLDDLGAIYVDFDLPERYLGVLRQGLPIQARSDAFANETFSGTIQRIDSRVNPQTRAVTARAEFPNPGGRLKPGMLLRVVVEQGARQGLAVPESAIVFEGDASYVYVAAPGGRAPAGQAAGGQRARQGGAAGGGQGGGSGLSAQRRPIQIGARTGGVVEVTQGLRPTDRVIADGVNRVNPGQPVRLAGQGGAAPAGGRAAGAR
jgi:membrane fusion protein, multidrug efflux system